MVSVTRWSPFRGILTGNASLGPGFSGLLGQVVALSKWSPYPSGRLIQVVALTGFAVIKQVSVQYVCD